MIFPISVTSSAASPDEPAYDRQVVDAFRSAGGKNVTIGGGWSSDGVYLQITSGPGRSGNLLLETPKMSAGVCRAIFQIVKQTQSFVDATDYTEGLLKVEGTITGAPPVGFPIEIVGTPEALCANLENGYREWRTVQARPDR